MSGEIERRFPNYPTWVLHNVIEHGGTAVLVVSSIVGVVTAFLWPALLFLIWPKHWQVLVGWGGWVVILIVFIWSLDKWDNERKKASKK